ncbi:type VII secretion protein EccE [Kribbella sancticallisti]|uniref:Type VII secretion protein EccE n=1 Tax=Kribbella sancticallisti TaxID=460087 RepID=A0ABN2DQG7_9ACTN
MTNPDALSTRFPRPEQNAVMLGLRPVQIALLLTAVGAVTLSFVIQMSAIARLGGLAVAPVCLIVAFGRAEELPVYRWLTLRGIHAWRSVRGQQKYRARVAEPRRHGRLQLPGKNGTMRIITSASGLGVVHDPRRRRLVAVARIEGPAHLLQNADEQDRRVAAYGRLIAGLCQGNRIARAQILERTLPDPADELGQWAQKRKLDPRTPAGAIYTDLLAQAAPTAARHETLFSFAVNLDAVSRDVRKNGGGLTGAAAVLESEARAFQTSLAAAGVAGAWLNAGELAFGLRTAFDPVATRTIPDPRGLDAVDAGPLAVDASWDQLRTDSSLHRVYVVTEWPRIRATPSFLSPLLLKPGIRRTFTIVLQPIPMAKALRDARRHQVERVSDRATRSRIGQLETEADRQLDADVAQRERDLAAGHGDVRWLGLLVVSADSEDALDDACMEIEIAATQALLDLRRLVGQQLEGFIAAALPFGVGLG